MDGIFELENVLTENECERLIELYNENPEKQHAGLVDGGRIEKKIKNTTDVYIDPKESYYNQSTVNLIHIKCTEGVEKYIKHLQKLGLDRGDKEQPSVLSAVLSNGMYSYSYPQIQRVDVDGEFNWHVDFSTLRIRLLHFIFYLSDPESYSGGKTEFCDGRIIEPKRGKLLIFPCSPQLIHRGNVVKKGVKYICSVFKEVTPQPCK